MPRLAPKHLLLLLAVVFGQWLVLAHAHDHAPQAIEQICQICLHAPGIATGALGGKPAALPLAPRNEVPRDAAPCAPPSVHAHTPRIRGPPVR
ncbi:hypothetical protein [Sinimarinibacterium thermocellulolyticum]|uniref:DUF2946 domain-containing protein n=1 Tax=Sinimarinibacterium thermocellulolyticum TaxID=3170016 RepID=A0ABV2A666_9GAMM